VNRFIIADKIANPFNKLANSFIKNDPIIKKIKPPDDLQTLLTKKPPRTSSQLVKHSHWMWEQIWTTRQNGHDAISPQRFSVFWPNLVRVMTTMTWGYLHSFGTMQPSGHEIYSLMKNLTQNPPTMTLSDQFGVSSPYWSEVKMSHYKW